MSFILNVFGFGKKPDPETTLKECSRKLAREARSIESTIRKLQQSHNKARASVANYIKDGHETAARTLTKEVVRHSKEIARRQKMKSHVDSLSTQMKLQLAQLKVSKAIEMSSEILGELNKLVGFKELKGSMTEMSREMAKSGLIQERIDDTFEEIDSTSDAEIDAEANKIMLQITNEAMANISTVPTTKVPEKAPSATTKIPDVIPQVPTTSDADREFLETMRARNSQY